MMNVKNPLYTTPAKFGAFGALLLIVLYCFMFYMGRHPLPVGFADVRFLLLPIFIFFSIKEFKDYQNDKILHFWQGLVIGTIALLAIGLGAALFIYVFAEFIDTRFLTQYIAERIKIVEENKAALIDSMNKETVEEQLRLLPQTTALDISIGHLAQTMGIGIFFNIIISVILRRQPKRFT